MKNVILLLMEVGSYITHFFSEMDSVELMLDIKKKKSFERQNCLSYNLKNMTGLPLA